VLLAGLYLLAVRTRWGQRLDDAAFDGRTTRPAVLRATGRLLDTISVGSLAFLGGAILGIAAIRRRVHLALIAGAVVLGANVTTQLLKDLVLGRTDLVPPPDLLGPSFPSGHTTVAMSLAIALVLVVPARMRITAALFGLIYACMVGTGTVTAGWHRPSDVMGGFLVVIVWGAGATALLLRWRGAGKDPGDLDPPELLIRPGLALLGAALLGIAFVGFAAVFIALRQDRLDAVRLGGAFVASLAAIVGVGLVGVAGLLTAIQGVGLDPPSRARD
jgi:membrane-associated phospholipid phosphatase